jgi:hypothetical protein
VTPGSLLTNTKPGLGYHWSAVLSKRIYFTPSKDRLDAQIALLSGSHHELEDVLTWESLDGKVFPVVDWQGLLAHLSVLEWIHMGQLRSQQLYIGRYLVFAPNTPNG